MVRHTPVVRGQGTDSLAPTEAQPSAADGPTPTETLDAIRALRPADGWGWETGQEDCEIDGYVLRLTCTACPEQYDVLIDGEQVGYLRLRHGWFYAEVPDVGGETVYQADPEGDGCFERHERERFLTEAVAAIHAWRTARSEDDGQPDEAQEWADYDPEC